ncbi:hypothetical protein ACS0TY_007176 [Phlomoides rotata]
MILHWDQHELSDISGTFDIIVASDCTFFKKFHKGLARTIRCLLKEHGPSRAILFSPKRGDSLDKFLVEVKESGLHFTITETYDSEIWRRHKNIINEFLHLNDFILILELGERRSYMLVCVSPRFILWLDIVPWFYFIQSMCLARWYVGMIMSRV